MSGSAKRGGMASDYHLSSWARGRGGRLFGRRDRLVELDVVRAEAVFLVSAPRRSVGGENREAHARHRARGGEVALGGGEQPRRHALPAPGRIDFEIGDIAVTRIGLGLDEGAAVL